MIPPESLGSEQNTPKAKKTFFQKIAFIFLDDKRKTEVAEEIIEDTDFGKLYRLQIVLSVIICSLGLLINSVPVIIGAMLIAPILIPIKTIAFSIATGNSHLYKKGLKISLLSIIVTIAISRSITKILPTATLTSEIYARISPTLIDLFIALAGGSIAFLSLGFKKLREGIAGVAMATALIPPLCVTGIGISFLDMKITQGSFLLFLTNFVAIIFVGIAIFYGFGFFPTNRKGKKRSIQNIILTILIIAVIIMPLTQSMKNIADDIRTKQTIENVANDFFSNISTDIEIEKISYQTQDNDTLRISTTIDVPSTTSITEKQKDDLSQILALSTQKSVNLDINIVNISSVLIEKKEEATKEEQLQKELEKYINGITGVIIIESKIAYNPSPLVYINLFAEKEMEQKNKIGTNIQDISQKTLGTGTNAFILRQGTKNENDQTIENAYYQDIKKIIQNIFDGNISIDTFKLEEQASGQQNIDTITMEVKSSLSSAALQDHIQKIKEILEKIYANTIFVFQIQSIAVSQISVK